MQIGQRVEYIGTNGTLPHKIGRTLEKDGSVGWLVEFLDWQGGHGGNSVNGVNLPDNHSCWWINDEDLRVVNFQPGDIVYTNPLPGCIRHKLDDSALLTNEMCRHLYAGVVIRVTQSEAEANTLVEFDSTFTTGHEGCEEYTRQNGCRWVKTGELRLWRARRIFGVDGINPLQNDRVIVKGFDNPSTLEGKLGIITSRVEYNFEKAKVKFFDEGLERREIEIPICNLIFIPNYNELTTYRTDIIAAQESEEEMPYIYQTTDEHEKLKDEKKKEEDEKVKCGICSRMFKKGGGVFSGEVTKQKKEEIEKLLNIKLEHVCYFCGSKFTTCDECKNLVDLRQGIRSVGALWLMTGNDRILLCKKCVEKLEGEITRCTHCAEFIFNDDAEWEDEEPYCPGCYDTRREQENDVYDYQRGKNAYKEMPFTTFTQLPQRNYGVEIETYCDNGNSVPKEDIRPWLRYIDGSLNCDGEEFASPIFAGDAGLKEIRKLLTMLKSNGYYVASECAVHCHVDARDYKFRDIRRFLLFMYDYEDIIYSFLRRPCSGGASTLSQLLSRDRLRKVTGWKKLKVALYGKERVNATSKWGDIRYRGLNVHSYFFRKTFEFRYLGATMYADEICNFARFAVFAAENGKSYKTTKKIIKPTLKEMAHILQMPKDLHEYFAEWQKKHDGNRHIERREVERI